VAQPLIVTLPPGLDLWPGCIIRVTAVDPATGATVTGVKVGNISIEGDQLAGPPLDTSGRVLIQRQA
jgi:hypothetical protein